VKDRKKRKEISAGIDGRGSSLHKTIPEGSQFSHEYCLGHRPGTDLRTGLEPVLGIDGTMRRAGQGVRGGR
jgi:hypothetical protein